MSSSFKNGFYAGLLAAFILGLWLVHLWGAENQVRLHSEHLIREMAHGRWSAIGDFVATNYHDKWGDDRAELLARLRLILPQASLLTITTASEPRIELGQGEAVWRARIKVEGKSEAAAEIGTRLNRLTTAFQLHWRHESRKPWDWKLISADNPQLVLPSGDW